MYLGRIVEEADTETLFTKPQHPYTEALLSSVLTPDPNLGVHTHLGAAYPNPVEPPADHLQSALCESYGSCSVACEDNLDPDGQVECQYDNTNGLTV